MVKYATGIKSRAICDRCGFEYPFLELREEWTGHKVCTSCWEPKQPQLEPRSAVDATLLHKPRPGANDREDATPRITVGTSTIVYLGYPQAHNNYTHAFVATSLEATSALGTEALIAAVPQTGLAATSALGATGISVFTEVLPTGVEIVSALGDEFLLGSVIETGVQATSALGTEIVTASATVTGVQADGTIGNELPLSAKIPTGVQATFAVGSVAIDIDGWGGATWGSDEWGDWQNATITPTGVQATSALGTVIVDLPETWSGGAWDDSGTWGN